MRWWRLKRRGMARVGLLALVFHLVLAFGHSHAHDLGAAHGQSAAVKLFEVSGSDQMPNGHPEDDCPICVAMRIAASGVLPEPAVIVEPAACCYVSQFGYLDALSVGNTRYVLFQTRAPPIA
jgi:hypothetical protein